MLSGRLIGQGGPSGVYVRSVGAWLSWEDEYAGGNLPQPASKETGDLLIVFGHGVAVSRKDPVSGWTRLKYNNSIFYSRIATGSDTFAVAATGSTGGQGGGVMQMAAFAGLDWTTVGKDEESSYVARNQDLIYPGENGGTESDTLVLIGVGKTWGSPSFRDPYPPGGIQQPYADVGLGISMVSDFKYQQGGDREIVGVWGWRYDEGSGTAVSQGDLNQTPARRHRAFGW